MRILRPPTTEPNEPISSTRHVSNCKLDYNDLTTTTATTISTTTTTTTAATAATYINTITPTKEKHELRILSCPTGEKCAFARALMSATNSRVIHRVLFNSPHVRLISEVSKVIYHNTYIYIYIYIYIKTACVAQ